MKVFEKCDKLFFRVICPFQGKMTTTMGLMTTAESTSQDNMTTEMTMKTTSKVTTISTRLSTSTASQPSSTSTTQNFQETTTVLSEPPGKLSFQAFHKAKSVFFFRKFTPNLAMYLNQ